MNIQDEYMYASCDMRHERRGMEYVYVYGIMKVVICDMRDVVWNMCMYMEL